MRCEAILVRGDYPHFVGGSDQESTPMTYLLYMCPSAPHPPFPLLPKMF